jgi:hypothetical protein
MGAKLMGYFELLLFTYQQDVFIKHLNELFRLLIQNRLLIDEFKTLEPVFIIAIKFIRTNPIMFPEQTDAFQLTRKIMDIAPQLIYH